MPADAERVRALARPMLAAVLLSVALGLLGTLTVAFSDYEIEAQPAATALAAGDLGRFVELAPAYGGSLVLRAPFALAAGLLGWGQDEALYRMLVLPALLAGAWLGVALFRRLVTRHPRGAWLALGLATANPLTLRALEVGHPEEILGAVLCVAAVLLALGDRALAAGVVLGLAGANKPWAVLAVVPVLLALDRDRVRCLVAAGVTGGLLLAPLLLAGPTLNALAATATAKSQIFQPWQVFWFFGTADAPVVGTAGLKADYRVAVDWALTISHPAVVLVGFALALAWVPLRRREASLLLLALVFLTRCLLDTWNTNYYALPFLLALLAHEAALRRRVPLATAAVTTGLWVSFEVLKAPDAQAAAYLAVALPTWVLLALGAFMPARAAALAARAQGLASRALPTLADVTARQAPTTSATAPARSGALTARP